MNAEDKRRREVAKFLDNLTEFLDDDTRGMPELAEDLRSEGFDPSKLLKDFQDILSQYAPTWRERATRDRLVAQEALQNEARNGHKSREDVKREIQAIVESMRALGAETELGAYHHRFQESQDGDLESLLQDLGIQLKLLKGEKKASRDG